MQRYQPHKISEILDHIKQRPELRTHLNEREALRLWAQTVGPKCAAQAEAVDASRGILTIKCRSWALRNEITLQASSLIEIINHQAGPGTITSIRFI